MSQKLTLRQLLRSVYVGAVLVVSGLWLIHAQEKQNPNYTGKVTQLEMNAKVRAARLHFEPGARTKWHSHEKGQILLCQEGVAHTQVKGQPVQELHPGDTTYVSGGVPHWHGAAPGQSTTLFSIDVSSGTNTWMDEVSEKEYTTPPKR
jgi:quercetin dioxygenase-like cupin family protein